MHRSFSHKVFPLLLSLFWIPSLWLESEEPSPYTLIPDKTQVSILAPSIAPRQTLKMELPNQLKVYLVSDPAAEKSAAVLIMAAGSWQDPQEHQGMAHFLEHMLFLGTQKYPGESSYSEFISENGGKDNAYTDDLHTAYLFEINNYAFGNALDRFAEFFKTPLLIPSGVSREMHAIAQEYGENKQNDEVRSIYVAKALSNPEHPDSKFNIGNSQTLGTVSHQDLRNWFEQHYSSNLATLVLYSPLPLETLKKYAVDYFSDIPNRHLPSFSLNTPIFGPLVCGRIAYIAPVNDTRTLSIYWEIPPALANLTETRPEDLVSYLLGDETPGSLYALLKEAGLIEHLKCGKYSSDNNNALFYLEAELTREGVHHIDEIVERCFQAIALIRDQGIPRRIFDELQRIQTLKYQYPSRYKPFQEVFRHSRMIWLEDLSTYPEQTSIIQKYDPAAIRAFVQILTPTCCYIDVIAPPKETGVLPDRKEPWMDVEYAVKEVPPGILKQWETASPPPTLHLPSPNPFVPNNLTLLNPPREDFKQKGPYPQPKKLIEDDFGIVYFAEDAHYHVPEIYWAIKIITPQTGQEDVKKAVLTDLYVELLKDTLNPITYPALITGLAFNIEHKDNGILITLNGYHEKASVLFENILHHLKMAPPTKEKFKILQDLLRKQYLNTWQESSLTYGNQILKDYIYEDFVTDMQKAKAVRGLKLSDYQEFSESLFGQTYTQALFYGNMKESEAESSWHQLQERLKSHALPLDEQPSIKVATLPTSGPFEIFRTSNTPGNAIFVVLEKTPFSLKAQAMQAVLSQALGDRFFDQLRTQQQTGYLVYMTQEELERHLFTLFIIQSHTVDPKDLLARIELFIESTVRDLRHRQNPSEKTFEIIRNSLIANGEQFPESLRKMGEELSRLAFRYKGDFQWRQNQIQGLKELTYEEFLQSAGALLDKSNKQRLAIVIRGEIPEDQNFYYTKVKCMEWLKQRTKYEKLKTP